MVLKGNDYMGDFAYTISEKWIPDPIKKSILYFSS